MDIICEAKQEAIVSAVKPLIMKHFPDPPHPLPSEFKPNQYAILFEKRNNSLDKEAVIKEVASIVPPFHCVNLTNPELCIIIQIIKSACGISVVNNYQDYRKFNIQILAIQGPLLPEERIRLENKQKVKVQDPIS